MFSKGYKISFYGPRVSGNSLSRLIMNQLDRCYFPGERGLMAKVRFKELGPERFRIGNLEIRTFGVNHTITSLAYRIQKAKSSIGYTGDNEPPNQVDSGYTGRLVDFFQGCDLLIAEAQYTDREYRKRVGWGHSSLSHAIELATASKVQRLVIFHYDCSYTDTLLDRLQARLRDQALRKGLFLGVFMAREGMELVI
jgi:ribonuclease BN (tRNA processing enzyme)